MPESADTPRPEHPRPQFQRDTWLSLNGRWTYTFDFGKSGMNAGRELFRSRGFADSILAPFCPESALSGVGYTDFIEAMWQHRTIDVPAEWRGKRVLLHFGGVDYEAEVFVDGVPVGTHYGGGASFHFDVTRFVEPGGSHDLVVRVLDELRTAGQPRGKQSKEFKSSGCSYTRTTGIWQTVWLEAVDPHAIESCQILPDLDGARLTIVPRYHSVRRGLRLRVTVNDGRQTVATESAPAVQGSPVSVAIDDPKPWGPGSPFLYDLLLEVAGDSLQEVAFFVASKLAPLEGVKSTASHFLLKKYKEAGFILEEDETYERLKVVP